MERIRDFHPLSAALLNVTADHLDRYASMAAYAAAKGNCFVNQTASDRAVAPANDDVCLAQVRRGNGRVVTFGKGADVEVTDDAVIDHLTHQTFSRREIALSGGHNALNVAAALASVGPFEISHEVIAKVLAQFRGLDHRMSFVAERRGARFYDDSKGTNVGASVTAVLGVSEPKVVLIAGGRDKGGSYEPLVDALREKGRAVVVIGEASDAIMSAVNGALPTARASTMDEAVAKAAELAQRGDAVLLSPACSSFDMFRDYKHRGDEFARAVRALDGGT